MIASPLAAQETSAPSGEAVPTEEPIVQSVDLGVREQGRTYPLNLVAENYDCRAPQDFRFDLSGTPWLRALGEPVARQVEKGTSKTVRAELDFSGVPVGPVEGSVRVVCETCGFIPLIKNCRISDKILLLQARVTSSSSAGGGTTLPVWPPLPAQPLPEDDPILAGLAPVGALDAAAVAGAMSKGKNPCEELARRVAALEAAEVDCSKAEAEVEAARAALAAAEAADQVERARRAELLADAREKVSRYQAANAAAGAAEARANAARSKLDAAKQAALNAFLQQTGLDAAGISLTPPPGMNIVQPGQTNGRTPPYAQALPLGAGVTIYYVDDGGLWNAGNSRTGAARLKTMFAHEIDGGPDLIGAIADAQADLDAALAALAEAEAKAEALSAEAGAADAAAHGLAPFEGEATHAEARLDAALAALEACRRRAAALAASLEEARKALAECETLVAAQTAIDNATKAIKEAEAAVDESAKAARKAKKARKGSKEMHPVDRFKTQQAADEAASAQAEAEAKLDEARTALANGDPAGASQAAGAAGAAATRAQQSATEAVKAARDGVERMNEDAAKTGRQLEAFFRWLKDQGLSPEDEAKIDAILADLARARADLEHGDPSDLDMRLMYLNRLADALGGVGFARLNGVTASSVGAGIQALTGILYAIIESELTAAATRVGHKALMEGDLAESISYWVRKAAMENWKWTDGVLIIGRDRTGTAESYFIIDLGHGRYQVVRSSASGGVVFLGVTEVS